MMLPALVFAHGAGPQSSDLGRDRHISDGDAQRNLDQVLARKWKNARGFEFGIELAAIDGNAWTEDVWSFARRHVPSKLIMVRGRGDDGAWRRHRHIDG